MTHERLRRLTALLRERRAINDADLLTIGDLLGPRTGDEGPAGAPLALLLLFAALGEGSLRIRLKPEALAELWRRFGASPEDAEAASAAILAWSEAGFSAGLVGAAAPLVHADGGLYFQRYYFYKIRLERALRARLALPVPVPSDLDALAGVLGAVTPPFMRDNPEQRQAIALALLSPFLVLSGGPGTGKTTTLVTLLRALVRRGTQPEGIRLLAPTGRAANRMAESVREALARLREEGGLESIDAPLAGLVPQTIHRALGVSLRRSRPTFGKEQPLAAEVVVVDEVSMVDLVLMTQLLEAIPAGARLILVGDRNQLPSVEAGAVLASLTPEEDPALSPEVAAALTALEVPVTIAVREADTFRDRIVLLRSSKRGAGRLKAFAEARDLAALTEILAAAPELPAPKLSRTAGRSSVAGFVAEVAWPVADGAILRLTPPEERGARLKHERLLLDAWLRRQYPEGGAYAQAVAELGVRSLADCEAAPELLGTLFRTIDGSRILTLLRRGASGVEAINRRALHLLGAGSEIYPGLPILVTANDYTLGLYNGDVGVLVRPRDGVLRAAFRREGQLELLPLELLRAWEPAYAMTVHKSQGSEYGEVLLHLPALEEGGALLTREILYTGLTRGKRLALLLADPVALEHALTTTLRRDSALEL